jgi:hypothetical protein
VSHHVRKQVLGVTMEHAENLALIVPRDVASKLVASNFAFLSVAQRLRVAFPILFLAARRSSSDACVLVLGCQFLFDDLPGSVAWRPEHC